MFKHLREIILPRWLRPVDGVGGPTDLVGLARAQSQIKTAKQDLAALDANKDGIITKEEVLKNKELKDIAVKDLVDLQKLKLPELEKANQILTSIQKGQALDLKGCIQVLSDAAAALRKGLNDAVTASGKLPLSGADQKNLLECVNSKPYLASTIQELAQSGMKATTPELLQAYLKSLDPPEKANGIRSELAKDMAMDNVRAKYMQDPELQNTYKKLGLNTDPSQDTKLWDPVRHIVGDPKTGIKGLSEAEKKDPKILQAILRHPDINLAAKIKAIQLLSLQDANDPKHPGAKVSTRTLAEINQLIVNDRTKALSDIDKEAGKFYKSLGGTGMMPSTVVLSTGDGSGTQGLKAHLNRAIGFLEYGQPTKVLDKNQAEGLASTTKKFNVADPTKPVTVHLSAVGANNGSNNANKVAIEYNGQKYDFKVYMADGGQTKLEPVDKTKLPPNWTWDGKSQTLTLPPGAKTPLAITQNSNNFDEFQVTAAIFNVVPDKVALNLNDTFAPDQFDMKPIDPSSDDGKQIKQLVEYLKKHPEVSFTPSLQGNGVGDLEYYQQTGDLRKKTGDNIEIPGYGPKGSPEADKKRQELEPLRYSGLEIDFQTKEIKISSFTDPVRSSLSKDADLKPLIDALKKKDPDLSDNDILSGLRAFAILETLQKELPDRDLLSGAHAKIGNIQLSYEDYQKFKQAAGLS